MQLRSPARSEFFHRHRCVGERLSILSQRPTQIANLRFVVSTNGHRIVCADLQQKIVRIDPWLILLSPFRVQCSEVVTAG